MIDKRALRSMIRNEKRHFSQQELGEMSLCVCDSLLSNARLCSSDVILMYYPLPDEVDVTSVISYLYERHKTVLLPKVVSDTEMTIHRYCGEDSLVVGAYGIKEPCGEVFDNVGDIDLAVVPGMAFDCNGNRLGRGKGYYDRFLSRACNIYKVGVCFPFQMVDYVPCGKDDVRMDEIIS